MWLGHINSSDFTLKCSLIVNRKLDDRCQNKIRIFDFGEIYFSPTKFPGGHSVREPPDPISNSEVKTFSADGSVGSPHVRVGHRQDSYIGKPLLSLDGRGFFVGLYHPFLHQRLDLCLIGNARERCPHLECIEQMFRNLDTDEFRFRPDRGPVQLAEVIKELNYLVRRHFPAALQIFVTEILHRLHESFSSAFTSSRSCGRPLARFITMSSVRLRIFTGPPAVSTLPIFLPLRS